MILKNQVGMWLRKRQREPVVVGGQEFQTVLSELPDRPPIPDCDQLLGSEAELVALLREMGCEQTELTLRAFVQYAVFERSPGDVAVDLGVSKSVVYQAKTRVARFLRQHLRG